MALFDAHPAESRSTVRSASSPVPPPTPAQGRRHPNAVPQPTPYTDYAAHHTAQSEAAVQPQSVTASPYRRQTWRRKSSAMGLLAMIAALAANVIMALGFLPLVPVLRKAIEMARNGQQLTAAQMQMMIDPTMPGAALTFAFWLGAGALLLGIIAAIAGRGRGWGVLTILLSIVGPFLVGLFWVALAMN